MEAQENIKKERILKISKIYKEYFIITDKYEYYIPKEVIENFCKMLDNNLLFVDMTYKNFQLFKVKYKRKNNRS